MIIEPLINRFIRPGYFNDPRSFREARLFVAACLLTSLFSISYVILSVVFGYQRGIYFTAFNVVGYFILPFLVRTKLSLTVLGNLYTLLGSMTVLVLTWFSGGMWSAIYPWIIAIPVLALLIAGRTSAIYWSGIALLCMIAFGVLELQGVTLPVEYNVEYRTIWFLCILPGLLLIIMVVSMTFESSMRRALVDVEKQKETIEKQSGELEALVDEKDGIIGILAHDLKNPLANIGVLAKMSMDEKDPVEQKKLLAMIEKASNQAQLLVKDVLEMAELEQATLDNLRPVDAHAIIREVMHSFETIASNKGIRINFDGEDKTSEVLGEATYFRQVIENLISNALKFSEAGNSINITIEEKGRFKQIRIRDFGPGIPTDEEPRLFKRFSKLSTRPTAGESSSGLGLSLVKQYMGLMDGRVWYERPAGGGAAFVVEFSSPA
jgi:signal transduction histidine kinase